MMYYKQAEDPEDPPIMCDNMKDAVFEDSRYLKSTVVGDSTISTVFLVIDHGYGGLPILYETMIFGGQLDENQYRYASYGEAMEHHEKLIILVTEIEALLRFKGKV